MGSNVKESVHILLGSILFLINNSIFPFKNGSIAAELYAMSWYLMPSSCQKQVAHVIHRFQNGAVLTIGPFAHFDFETTANVRITFIYSCDFFLNSC